MPSEHWHTPVLMLDSDIVACAKSPNREVGRLVESVDVDASICVTRPHLLRSQCLFQFR